MALINYEKNFPDWDAIYSNDVTRMPWYEKDLDPDLQHQLDCMGPRTGRFLDLGTGSGTQAVHLDRLGFASTGSDISKNAIAKARMLPGSVNFVVDDILNSSFPDNTFDYVLDRGCFHAIDPYQRGCYLVQIRRILKDDGLVFLKALSREEKGRPGWQVPYRFSRLEIVDIFEKYFEIAEIRTTVFHGTLDPPPGAFFAVLRPKNHPPARRQ